jgi:transcriptional regulator with XRE-family HTH domain
MSVAALPIKETHWTPKLIRRLRGNRTPVELSSLLGVSPNEVLLWESGRSEPDEAQAKTISELAERERFLKDWKLAGSGVLLGSLEIASKQLSEELKQTLDERARRLQE